MDKEGSAFGALRRLVPSMKNFVAGVLMPAKDKGSFNEQGSPLQYFHGDNSEAEAGGGDSDSVSVSVDRTLQTQFVKKQQQQQGSGMTDSSYSSKDNVSE